MANYSAFSAYIILLIILVFIIIALGVSAYYINQLRTSLAPLTSATSTGVTSGNITTAYGLIVISLIILILIFLVLLYSIFAVGSDEITTVVAGPPVVAPQPVVAQQVAPVAPQPQQMYMYPMSPDVYPGMSRYIPVQ